MMQTAWLLFVLFHTSPATYGLKQLGPFTSPVACERAAKIVKNTDAWADHRYAKGPMDAVCVPDGEVQ